MAEGGHITASRTVSSQAHGEHILKAAGTGLQKKKENQPKQQIKTIPPRKQSIPGLSHQHPRALGKKVNAVAVSLLIVPQLRG